MRTPSASSAWLHALARRIHFYAGILVAPFIAVAAASTARYTLTQADIDRGYLDSTATFSVTALETGQTGSITATAPRLALPAVQPSKPAQPVATVAPQPTATAHPSKPAQPTATVQPTSSPAPAAKPAPTFWDWLRSLFG